MLDRYSIFDREESSQRAENIICMASTEESIRSPCFVYINPRNVGYDNGVRRR